MIFKLERSWVRAQPDSEREKLAALRADSIFCRCLRADSREKESKAAPGDNSLQPSSASVWAYWMPVKEILVHLVDPDSRRQFCHLHPVLISSQFQCCSSHPCSVFMPPSILTLCSALLMSPCMASCLPHQLCLNLFSDWKYGFLVSVGLGFFFSPFMSLVLNKACK